MSSFSYVVSNKDLEASLKLARGVYQRNVLLGYEALSGSTLKGKAQQYKGRYQASARALLARMKKAGIPWCEMKSGSKRVLVIGHNGSFCGVGQ